MADESRIVYPDEVEAVKEAVKASESDATSGGDTNTIEEKAEQPSIALRNMISVPDNCPPGFKKGADGVCREVFD